MTRYRTQLGVGLGLLSLLFAVLSAMTETPILAFGVVGVLMVVMVGGAWEWIPEKAHGWTVFLLGLATLYQTTLISPGLIGTDIHTEYYIYLHSVHGWDTSLYHSYNSAVGTTLLAPFFHWMGVPGYWIYKAIFPAMFAVVGVLLYSVYSKEFGAKIAFLGCIMFVTLPTYMLEMIGLPRQMLGELMLAVVMFLVVTGKVGKRWSVWLLLGSAVLGTLFHYVMGPIILAYLVVYVGVVSLFGRWLKEAVFPVKWAVVVVSVMMAVGMLFYTTVSSGLVWHNLTDTVSKSSPTASPLPVKVQSGVEDNPVAKVLNAPQESHRYGPMLRAALGLDFREASVLGKLYRLLQFIMEICIGLGVLYLWRNRKKLSAEFVGFAVGSLCIVGAGVVVPNLIGQINASRAYHLALFTLSPLMIAGGLRLFRGNLKVMTSVLLIPYMLFSTGAVFEVSKSTAISDIDIPYSIALSGERVQLTGICTENDLKVRDWVVENLEYCYADTNGGLLLMEKKELEWGPVWVGMRTALVDGFPDGAYIFLTEQNNRTGTVVFKPYRGESSTGMRVAYGYEEVGLVQVLRDSELVYGKGRAAVVRVKPSTVDRQGQPKPIGLKVVESWYMPTEWDKGGHSQGAATDGKYVWWSLGDKIVKSVVGEENWEKPLAVNEDASERDEIAGVWLEGQYLYATDTIMVNRPYRCWVVWFDKDTLVKVGEKEVFWPGGGSTQEGITWHNGSWWMIFFDQARIAQFDSEFNYVKSYTPPSQTSQMQGEFWLGERLWTITADEPVKVFYFDGIAFSCLYSLQKPKEVVHAQSIGIEPDGKWMYWADFQEKDGKEWEVLHKVEIEWSE